MYGSGNNQIPDAPVTEESRQEKWLELCTYYQLGSNVLSLIN